MPIILRFGSKSSEKSKSYPPLSYEMQADLSQLVLVGRSCQVDVDGTNDFFYDKVTKSEASVVSFPNSPVTPEADVVRDAIAREGPGTPATGVDTKCTKCYGMSRARRPPSYHQDGKLDSTRPRRSHTSTPP